MADESDGERTMEIVTKTGDENGKRDDSFSLKTSPNPKCRLSTSSTDNA